jgi:hypothetical protein
MEVLIETVSGNEGNIITEAHTDKDKNVYLSGIVMQASIKNRNGRVYPLDEMTNAVTNLRKQITECGGVPGELDHPKDGSLTISMDRISHLITELHLDGDNVYGKIKLMNTPMGMIAKELARSGFKYGVSSRGVGNVSEDGTVSGFVLVTIDAVATPSAPGATPMPVYEALERLKVGNKVLTLAEAVTNDMTAQKYFKKEMDKFIQELLKK